MTVEYRQLNLESSYLDDYRTAIRAKTIPWDGFVRTQTINQEESKVLISLEKSYFDKKSFNEIKSFDEIIKTLLDILSKNLPIERNDVKKFILVVLSDLLNIDLFLNELINLNKVESLSKSLVSLADNSDEIIRLLALYNSSILLIQNNLIKDDESILKILNELIELISINNSNFNLKFFSINLISEILLSSSINKNYRSLFWLKHDELLPELFKSLNLTLSSPISNSKLNTIEGIQFQYKILLILWILSFEKKNLNVISKIYLDDLLVLIKILKISIKEKISRLIISILLNLTLNLEILKYLILNGDFINILNNLKERKWSDDELILDLENLTNNTIEIFNKLTSFDEYLQELNLKKFKNSPVHYKEEFFLDNITKFQENNYKVFKQILLILDDDHLDSNVLKILLNDLNKLLRIDLKFIDILTQNGYKVKIMQLLNHKNSEVRYEALKITQLLVSQSLK